MSTTYEFPDLPSGLEGRFVYQPTEKGFFSRKVPKISMTSNDGSGRAGILAGLTAAALAGGVMWYMISSPGPEVTQTAHPENPTYALQEATVERLATENRTLKDALAHSAIVIDENHVRKPDGGMYSLNPLGATIEERHLHLLNVHKRRRCISPEYAVAWKEILNAEYRATGKDLEEKYGSMTPMCRVGSKN